MAATIDLLATVSLQDGQIDRREVDLLLDLLHGTFPEEDRSWITRQLTLSLSDPHDIAALGAILCKRLNPRQRQTLAFKVYVLMQANGGTAEMRQTVFLEICEALQVTGSGEVILEEMRRLPRAAHLTDPTPTKPFEKLIFAHGDTGIPADVMLPVQARDTAFAIYFAEPDLWVRNVGRTALMVRGMQLARGQFIRMIDEQSITVPHWQLNYGDLLDFIRMEEKGTTAFYLGLDDGQLEVSRTRGRGSAVNVTLAPTPQVLGLNADSRVILRGMREDGPHSTTLREGDLLQARYDDVLEFTGGTSITVEKLRRESLETGGSFRLSPDQRECLVSNDPSGLRGRDVLLSRGLASRVTLRILFDPDKAKGLLEVIESDALITVNNQPVRYSSELEDGSLIRLSPNQAIRCRFSEGLLDEERTMVTSLQLRDLCHTFPSGTQAFDGIDLTIKRGELVGIMGPSGCGKSSLLSALSGYLRPRNGSVLINGVSLYDHTESLLPYIAHLPQEEALSGNLTVREHLRHALMVRRPQLSMTQHRRRVDALLGELGLTHRENERVGSLFEKHLSGGERGRLDLGLDFGSTAEILLIDEPNSGLSSKDAEHITDNLRALSRDKIVICSLHTPGAKVLHQFDKILLLDKGGRPAFYGSPAGMISYFLDAARELELPSYTQSTAQYGAEFVFDVMETPMWLPGVSVRGSTRRFPPEFWQERFVGHTVYDEVSHHTPGEDPQERVHPVEAIPPPQRRRLRAIASLAHVHLQRSFLSKFRTKGTLYSILLEAPLLAGLIAYTLRASPGTGYEFGTALHIPIFLFLSVTIAMFLGLTNSATEILNDAPVLRRERSCRSVVTLYTGAKFATLALLAGLQAATYLLVSHQILEIQGMFWHHWGWFTLTSCVGTALAMFISAVVKSERAALSAVPLILVPQMLLAGALVSFGEMNRGLFSGGGKARDAGAEPVPARVMPLRYAFEGILLTQANQNPFATVRTEAQTDLERLKEIEKLSPEQRTELNFLRDFLLRFHVAEASSAKLAGQALDEFAAALSSRSSDELRAIEMERGEKKKRFPINHYFGSERVDLLTSAAELKRKDYRRGEESYDIFFAAEKSPFGQPVRTTTLSLLVLGGTIVVSLISTVFAIRWRHSIKL